jgi:hypothetical protein
MWILEMWLGKTRLLKFLFRTTQPKALSYGGPPIIGGSPRRTVDRARSR